MANELKIGTTLQRGKYRIIKGLGQSTFNITYLAEHVYFKKYVVIKEFFLRDLCVRDESSMVCSIIDSSIVESYSRCFSKEAQIITQLDHPGIIKLIESFIENGTEYHVMEYIEGLSLRDIVSRDGALPEQTALRYVSRVAEAIDYLHHRHINHFDVKPSNILVRRKDDMPILIDFGIAKQYIMNECYTSSYSPPMDCYTQHYAPFEQIAEKVEKFSPQIDIYALGATLYNLLTGSTPPGPGAILEDGLPKDDLLNHGVSESTIAVIEKAMQPHYKNRYQTASEFIEAIGECAIDYDDDDLEVEVISMGGQEEEKFVNSLPIGTELKGPVYIYTIQKVLGQGGFGITYLASVKLAGPLGAIDANISVCIKEFFMKNTNGRGSDNTTVTSGSGDLHEGYMKKFEKEAINLSKMTDNSIINVIESFKANNTVYYSMEYIDGGSLDDYIKLHTFTEEEAVQTTLEIGKAVSFMHSKRMLHLDLKPKNIMRRKSGEYVLIDFGLSKQYLKNGVPETSTPLGLGTPGYAPIEQMHYRKEDSNFPVTIDVYALGATMYKMLLSTSPPDSSFILNEGFPYEEFERRHVSKALTRVIAKAMEPRKKDRYPTIDAFMKALRALPARRR